MTARFTIALCSLCLSGVFPVNAQSPGGVGSKRNIDSAITQMMKENGMVGIGAAIIVNKKLVWENAYGFADREERKPFTTSTVMNIASVSKTITGVCLMKAVEQGKVKLDEDINRYLPFKIVNPYHPSDAITLRQLATHTSGLADRYPFYTDSLYFPGKDSPEPLGNFLKNYFVPGGRYYAKENFLDHKPGTYRDYSNIGAALAGYIVERRTGNRLNQYSKKYIFEPLSMQHSSWFLSETDLFNHAKLYDKKGSIIENIPLYGCTTYPDGGVRTSVDDLAKFFTCLLNDGTYGNRKIMNKQSVQEMLRFQFTPIHKPENVDPGKLNSGIFWATKMGGKRIGHNGSDPGVRIFMLSDLEREIAVIFFSNTSLSETEEDKFFEIYNVLYEYGLKLRDSAK